MPSKVTNSVAFFVWANTMTDPRHTRRYRKFRQQLRNRAELNDAPCWICGGTIDYLAPAHDPNSWELDHVKSVLRHPELAYDPANARDSHASCNTSRGADGQVLGLGKRRKRL